MASSSLARRQSLLDELASLSRQGNVDDLAMELARHAGASLKKQLAVTGLKQPIYERLMTNSAFRKKLTERLTYLEVTPLVEHRIVSRMVREATDESSSFDRFTKASDWLLQQGGMKRGEKTELEVGGSIQISFVVDAPEGLGPYKAPDPLAGVTGRNGVGDGADADVVDAEYRLAGEAEDSA